MSGITTGDDEVHMSVYASPSLLGRKSRVQRRSMMQRCKGVYPVSVYVLAVIELQRLWRGILLRRRVVKKYLENTFHRLWREEEAVVVNAYRSLPRAMESRFIALTKRVQARWRTVLLKKEFDRWASCDRWPLYYVAAATIQRAWVDFRFVKRQRQHRNRSKRLYLTKEDAASARIQEVYRGYVNKSIFRFYKQLIKFREAGDPVLMLKSINPSESDFMDRASGLHVRFRLSGVNFPPYVVYKVFTHNNVADIGAFAPKDYTKARQHVPLSVTHNKESRKSYGAKNPKDRSGWYQRIDNNPWRPISDVVLSEAEKRAAEYDAKYAPRTATNSNVIAPDAPFHYSRLKRREAQDAKVKQKRRKWLAELYAAEQVELMQGHIPQETIKQEARELFSGMDDSDVSDEVHRLVDWTEHLDFANYRRDWLLNSTTAASDALLPSQQQTKERAATVRQN